MKKFLIKEHPDFNKVIEQFGEVVRPIIAKECMNVPCILIVAQDEYKTSLKLSFTVVQKEDFNKSEGLIVL